MITRLVEQKGIDLLVKSIKGLLVKRINFFVLGDGNAEVCEKLHRLSQEHDNFDFFDSSSVFDCVFCQIVEFVL